MKLSSQQRFLILIQREIRWRVEMCQILFCHRLFREQRWRIHTLDAELDLNISTSEDPRQSA
ncbi:MAG: hypothetical protein ACI93T_003001 [Porticoccaceae bacterium]|jgi:hypothetical protein